MLNNMTIQNCRRVHKIPPQNIQSGKHMANIVCKRWGITKAWKPSLKVLHKVILWKRILKYYKRLSLENEEGYTQKIDPELPKGLDDITP